MSTLVSSETTFRERRKNTYIALYVLKHVGEMSSATLYFTVSWSCADRRSCRKANTENSISLRSVYALGCSTAVKLSSGVVEHKREKSILLP